MGKIRLEMTKRFLEEGEKFDCRHFDGNCKCDWGLLTLKQHLLDNVVEDKGRFDGVKVLDMSRNESFSITINQAYVNESM